MDIKQQHKKEGDSKFSAAINKFLQLIFSIFTKTISKFLIIIDKFLQQSAIVQVSYILATIILLILIEWVGVQIFSSRDIDCYDVFLQSVNPSVDFIDKQICLDDMYRESPNIGRKLVGVFIFLLGSVFVTGLFITILVNAVDRRRENWFKGDVHYNIKSNFVCIIGGHKMVPNLCLQLLQKDDTPYYIVIQTRQPAELLRKEIYSLVEEKQHNRIIIYYGSRTSRQDLKLLNLDKANAIYLIGEDTALDKNEHDILNMQSLELIHSLLLESMESGKRIPCHVMFEYQSSFHVFQYTDLSFAHLDFIPFNIYKTWAQQVFVANQAGNNITHKQIHHHVKHCIAQHQADDNITYEPLDGKDGLQQDSSQHVHLIVIGMSKMGTAMAVEAAHLCHFPNFANEGNGHPRTLITFIDCNAEREMNFFKGRYRNMFQMARWRFRATASKCQPFQRKVLSLRHEYYSLFFRSTRSPCYGSLFAFAFGHINDWSVHLSDRWHRL